MRYAVIDTETSGFFDFSKPADAMEQPRLANLGIVLLDDDMAEVTRSNLYVKPVGWKMTEEAVKVHGLTDEVLRKRGSAIQTVIQTYADLIDQGHIIMAFNAQYDTKVMRGEMRRSGVDDRFTRTPNICLMRACTDICQIPRKRGGGFKFPKLVEACEFFRIPYNGSHAALECALAAAEIARQLKKGGCLPEAKVHYAKNRPV